MVGLSFDIEDYFQVSNFESHVAYEDWPKLESRVERNSALILEILAERCARATFFVLGWVAERFPHLVRSFAAAGHELGSHSFRHRLVYRLSPEEFRADLRLSIDRIQQAAGVPVLGHRAPSFSITRESLWAVDILQAEGLRYDSSVFPVRHPRYGIPDAPRRPWEIRPGFWEVPMATLRLPRANLPVAGGGYFRLYPYAFTAWALRRMRREGLAPIVYLHPWEFDPAQPRLPCGWLSRWRHYNHLADTAPRLRRILARFPCAPLRETLARARGEVQRP